jgi:metal-responsive CopG/Arc/MetJ family transcriptional regulator
VKRSNTRCVKIAVSVEDSLMRQADAAARELGVRRSGLISNALRE